MKKSGCLIREEDLPRIFENGYTGFNGREDKRASGIGLYLCKRIADNLGHKISAESMQGVGTKIYLDMNRKERQLAIKSALSHKYQDKELIVIDKIELENLKTKNVKEIIKDLKLDGKVLFVTKDENENLFMASRNLGYAYSIMADEINCYDIVNANKLVCDEEAVKVIEGGLK